MARHTPPVNGQVLYDARHDLDLTQLEVAELTRRAGYEVADSNLSKLERGVICHPYPRTRAVLLRVLHLTKTQFYAPCAACGREWSASCLDHDASEAEGPASPAKVA